MSKPVDHSLSLTALKQNRHPTHEDFIYVGDWCAFVSENNAVAVGRIMSFSYLTGTSLRNQEYSRLSAPTKAPEQNARGIGCHCTWFDLKGNSKALHKTKMDVHGYYSIDTYICTLPQPEVKEKSKHFFLPCNITDILKFKK